MFHQKDKTKELIQKIIDKLQANKIKIALAEYGTDGSFGNYLKSLNHFSSVSTAIYNIKSEKELASLLGCNTLEKKFLVNEASALTLSHNLLQKTSSDLALGIVFDKDNNYASFGLTTSSKDTKLLHNYTNSFTVKPAFFDETLSKITGDDTSLENNLLDQLLDKGFQIISDLL